MKLQLTGTAVTAPRSVLSSRRHIDLQRVSSALCRTTSAAC